MTALSKPLLAGATALSVVALALYLAGMLTPFMRVGDSEDDEKTDVFIWLQMCVGKPIGHKSCEKIEGLCDSFKSLMKASQAFFILSDIGSLAAAAAGALAFLGKVPAVAAVGATAAAMVFGTVTMGVTFPAWTQKQCGAEKAYSKVDGYKMGPALGLLIAAFIISIIAFALALVAFLKGGAAEGAGAVGASKTTSEEMPVRKEQESTLVPVQSQQNPLDKEPEAPAPAPAPVAVAEPAPEPVPAPVAEPAPAAAEKRAKVLAIDFEELKRKLPATKGDDAQKAQRFAMFDAIDVEKKGALNVQEVTAGLRDVLQVGDTVASLDQVIAKAFVKAAAAGQAASGNPEAAGAATVEKNEFRLLLLYVRQYFRVFQIFAAVDTTGDNKMALDEFRAAQPEFASMGLVMPDADATFHAIDADKSGIVDFHEFAMWALEQEGVLSG